MDDTLRVGDIISLYCEESGGYAYNLSSSAVQNGLYTKTSQSRENPEGILDPQGITFTVHLRNRYEFNKRYQKLQLQAVSDKNISEAVLSEAKLAAEVERLDNKAEIKRQLGRRIRYGQVIQLKHTFSQKYVHVSTTQTSLRDKNYMAVQLHEYSAKEAHFKILPRFKVKSEGDLVQINDQLVLESDKSPVQYLHTSAIYPIDHFNKGCEVNLGIQKSGFTIVRYRKHNQMDQSLVKVKKSYSVWKFLVLYGKGGPLNYRELHAMRKGVLPASLWRLPTSLVMVFSTQFHWGGSVVRLYHKEMEAYLVAEGLYHKIQEYCHLRVRPVDQSKPKSQFPPTSATTFWQLESQEGILVGDYLKWGQQIHIRHMTTKDYLAVDKEGSVFLAPTNRDPNTVFRLHSVTREEDRIEIGSYARIEHVLTERWLHALKDKAYCRQGDHRNDGLKRDKELLKQVSTLQQCMYDDAFTLQEVKDTEIERYNFIAGILPLVMNLEKDIVQKDFSGREVVDICESLDRVQHYMLVHGEPDADIQKLLRNLRVIDMLVGTLQNGKDRTSEHGVLKICILCYQVLEVYLMGDNRNNELYITQYVDFISNQATSLGGIGKYAMEMVTELFRNNRQIVDTVQKEQIDHFVKLVRERKDYRCLEMLAVLCVCDGKTLSENQTYIAKQWLVEDTSGVFLTDLGQSINRKKDVLYVSMTKGNRWQTMDRFLSDHYQEGKSTEEYKFLESQLDLFGKLCAARNAYAIDVITTKHRYLTWEEAYYCLCEANFPVSLRARYSDLVIHLFVDVGTNRSVVDGMTLSFVYSEVNDESSTTIPRTASWIITDNKAKTMVPMLISWIAVFLEANRVMTASPTLHNILVEHVLKLLYHLVKFGAYSSTGDQSRIRQLVPLLLAILDGRTDQPFLVESSQTNLSPESAEAIEHYQTELRFKPSPETTAIVNAKHQALEVIDLLMTLQFNQRLEKFIGLFKTVETGAGLASLQPMLSEDCNPFTNIKLKTAGQDIHYNLRKHALKHLDKILDATSYFVTYDIKGILLDLSNYEYDQMLCKAMTLLNKYYSKKDLLCTKAVQVKVLLSDESIKIHRYTEKHLPTVKRYINSKLDQDQARKLSTIFNTLATFCYIGEDEDQVHTIHQSILMNFGIPAILEEIFNQRLQSESLNVSRQEQKHQLTVLRATLRLVRFLVRQNQEMQLRMFTYIDEILDITGVEAEAAVALTEIFIGNQETCMKIRQSHIQKIVRLAAQHKEKVPELIDLLCATVKIDELNLPLKRNQGFVMKHVMQDYQHVAYVLDSSKEERTNILKGGLGSDHLSYLLSLVDLLATCAKGENLFIESLCRTIFPIDDLLEVLNDPDVSNNCKRPFLCFLYCTYLHTAAGVVDTGVSELPSKSHRLIRALAKQALKLEKYIVANPENTARLLRKSPPKNVLADTAEGQAFGTIHYFFDAVFPFLEIFYNKSLNMEDFPVLKKETDTLGKAILALSDAVGPLIVNPLLSKTLVKAVTAVIPLTTAPVEVIEKFITDHGVTEVPQSLMLAEETYYAQHADELVVNKKVRCFAHNIRAAYRGLNTVAEQLGSDVYISDLVRNLGCSRGLGTKMYTDLNSDEALPLGEEFQSLVSCFCANNYAHSQKLIDTLNVSVLSMTLDEQNSPAEVGLVVKCLQVLRALIHNEERKMLSNRDTAKVTSIQDRLNEFDCVAKTVGLADRSSDDVAREFFAFANAMLLNANPRTQAAFEKYFTESREEVFFYALKKRIALSSLNTVERRFLKSQYESNKKNEEALTANLHASLELANENTLFRRYIKKIKGKFSDMGSRSGRVAAAAGQSDQNYLPSRDTLIDHTGDVEQDMADYPYKVGSTPHYRGKSLFYLPTTDKNKVDNLDILQQLAHEEEEEALTKRGHIEASDTDIAEGPKESGEMYSPDSGPVKVKDEGCLELVLKLMAGMCDGQNKVLQDYFREQPDNFKSANLVADTTGFLSLLYLYIEPSTIDLVIQIFVTLNEFASGNALNVQVIYDSNIAEYVNHIIRVGKLQTCEDKQVLELWSAVSCLMMSMIEENRPDIAIVQAELKDILDTESIQKISTWAYLQAREQGMRETEYLQVGFKFFFMWMRLRDLGASIPDPEEEEDFRNENKEAFAYYSAHSRTIEILKDNELQVLRFRVKDEEVLREEVTEKLKWNIDRSSHNSKLRELMEWSQDIIDDIYYQRQVQAYTVCGYLIKAWEFSNAAVFCLSVLINIIMLATWEAKAYLLTYAPEDILPPEIHDPVPIVPSWYYTVLYSLGCFHNIFSVIVMVTFFVSSRPRLPSVMWLRDWYRASTIWGLKHAKQRKEVRISQLRIRSLSFVTLYYISFAVFSALGTAYHGYFFAFHLLNIVYNNQLLQRVIMAVTLNGRSLIWVTLLGMVVMYQFALAAFAYLRYAIDVQREDASLFCGTLFQCTATVLRYGLVGEIFEKMEVHLSELNFHNWGMLVLFHFVFFVLITTIGLNVIFGIILDTFSELRDNKWTAERDMKSICFICSKDAHEFDGQGNGFEHHVAYEHNMWAYIFFFIHLEATPVNDLTNLELYVWEQIAENKYDYFPVNRAMALQGQEISESDEKLDDILAKVKTLLEKSEKEDNKREREQERKRQRKWQQLHKDMESALPESFSIMDTQEGTELVDT